MKRGVTWWLVQALALALGGLFVFAGWEKVQDPSHFLTSIRGYHLAPDPFAAWLALSLPWLEIFAGLAVLTGVLRRGGLLLINASLTVFLAALGSAWARGLNIECGCFGAMKTGPIAQEMALDIAMLTVGAWLQWKVSRKSKMAQVAPANHFT